MSDATDVMDQINKAFGPGTLILGSDIPTIRHWPTGIIPIDVILDGGLPVGRFVEVFGDYSTLKSFLAYKALASVQKLGGRTALVDAERAYDAAWFAALGGDPDKLLVQRPETGEAALKVMEVLIRNGYDLIVWDSIAASQPKQYAEKAPGEDLQPGGQARMMSAGLRRLNSVNKTSTVLCINQTRVNVGMTFGGAHHTKPGGKAMGFYASYMLRFSKAGQVSESQDIWTGEKLESSKVKVKQKIKVTVEKWKLNAPVREVWLDFDLRRGQVDEIGYMIGWCIEQGFVEMNGGGGYTMGDLSVRGREKFFEAVAADQELVQWMTDEISQTWLKASPGSQETLPKSKDAKTKSKP